MNQDLFQIFLQTGYFAYVLSYKNENDSASTFHMK